MREALLVALGGGIGSGLRHLVGLEVVRRLGTSLPWGTWVVNLSGSFALACLAGFLLAPDDPHPDLRLLVAVGLLGGFTTYSTFNLEVLRLLQEGRAGAAAGYAALTLSSCLFVAWGGLALTRGLPTG